MVMESLQLRYLRMKPHIINRVEFITFPHFSSESGYSIDFNNANLCKLNNNECKHH